MSTDTPPPEQASDGADRWAAVTGSSRGIGRAIALELADAGYHVVVHAGHNRAAAEAVGSEIRNLGRQAEVVVADFSQAGILARFVGKQWDRHAIDLWVNNAGADVLTGQVAEASFHDKLWIVLQTDVVATMLLSRGIGCRMRERGKGSIVNIGWDQAEVGMAGDSGEMFAASKGAIMSFTRSLAKSLAPQVRVNCVAPGWIKTAWGEAASDYWQQRATDEALLHRWGTPEDVAQAVRFLASSSASFITGQVVPVNGGFAGSAE